MMRVIAGSLGGRRFRAPQGRGTRPTPERVREALFSSLEAALGGPGSLAGARVLDLFAGTGALGIEALSRGAAHATFVESEPRALEALAANLEAFDLSAQARLLRGDARRATERLGRAGERFDVAFLDPPFEGVAGRDALGWLRAAELLRRGAVAVLEHPSAAPPERIEGYRLRRTRRHGSVSFSVFERECGGTPAEGSAGREVS